MKPLKVGEKRKREVATGGDPVAALARANSDLAGTGAVYDIGVAHDDGCPTTALPTGSLADCTCEIIEMHVERLA